MAGRRSTRIQNYETGESVEVKPSAAVEVVRKKKREAPAETTRGTAKAKLKEKGGKIIHQQTKKPPVQTELGSTKDILLSLPLEILHMILNSIKDPSTISKLGRTCKIFYSLMMPVLHKRIIVAAAYHAHIAQLIRTLEPHLTIAQKKQLKKEGKYKGQQERYSSNLDAHLKPACTNYVRQIVVGHSDPGRKHKYIVNRYVEEAFKNMDNLEVVETQILTESMGHSIASLKNLQAIRLRSNNFERGAMKPLAKIRNLKHLSVDDSGVGSAAIDDNVIQPILQNSTSTLLSLDVKIHSYATNFLKDWEKKDSTDSTVSSQNHDFVALKSLTLSGISFDAAFIKSLQKAIDFMGLRELRLGSLSLGDHLFFQHLASLTPSSQNSATSVSLRTLCLDMSERDGLYMQRPGEKTVVFEAKCRFISSFDTLTTLILEDYGQYSKEITTNPGLPDILLQAIIKHKNLRTLRIPYRGQYSTCKIPYLSAATIATIIDNLPQLQEIEFAPEEGEIDEIGQALSRGTNLASVTCSPFPSAVTYPPPADLGVNILHSILNGFLSRDGGGGADGPDFIWEDHFKLKRVSALRSWEIASRFEKPAKKGIQMPMKMNDGSGKREVSYRFYVRPRDRNVVLGYYPDSKWVENVAEDIN